jgi:hypothetical protein
MCIVEVLLKQQDLFQVLFFHQIFYIYLNFIVLILWTTRDQFLFWFPFEESIGCLMEVAAHTLTTWIPQILTWLHHMVLLRDWIDIQNMIGECNLLYSLVSPYSQNPQSSHNAVGILSSRWTHCTLSLRSPSHQTWSCHNNHSKNPWHIHRLLCVGP